MLSGPQDCAERQISLILWYDYLVAVEYLEKYNKEP